MVPLWSWAILYRFFIDRSIRSVDSIRRNGTRLPNKNDAVPSFFYRVLLVLRLVLKACRHWLKKPPPKEQENGGRGGGGGKRGERKRKRRKGKMEAAHWWTYRKPTEIAVSPTTILSNHRWSSSVSITFICLSSSSLSMGFFFILPSCT